MNIYTSMHDIAKRRNYSIFVLAKGSQGRFFKLRCSSAPEDYIDPKYPFRSFQNIKVKKARTTEAEEKLTFSQTKFTIWGASSCHLCGLVSLTFYNA